MKSRPAFPLDPRRPDPRLHPSAALREPRLLTDLKHSLLTEARAAGFAKTGVCRPDAIPEAAGRLGEFVAKGRHGADGLEWPSAWAGAASDGAIGPKTRPGHHAGRCPTTPDSDPWRRSRGATGPRSVLRAEQGLSRPRQEAPQTGRSLAAGAGPGHEIKVFVDTAPGDGENRWQRPRASGWQGKHTNLLFPRPGQLVLPRRDLHHGALEPDPPEPEHLRQLHPPASTSAQPRPFRRLSSLRCGGAAFPT